jgi:hypothetical protein
VFRLWSRRSLIPIPGRSFHASCLNLKKPIRRGGRLFAQLDPSLDTSKSMIFSLFNPSCRLHCFCNPHSFSSNSDSNTRSKSYLRFAVGRLNPLRINISIAACGVLAVKIVSPSYLLSGVSLAANFRWAKLSGLRFLPRNLGLNLHTITLLL